MATKAKYHNRKDEKLKISDVSVSSLEKTLLSQSDLNFKTYIEYSPNMIFINKGGRIVYANNKCEEVMGYSREEFLSSQFEFISTIAPESVESVRKNFKRHMQGEEIEPHEYDLVTRADEKINVIISSKLIDYEGGRAILGIVTDITDLKQAEKSLLGTQKSYRKLISKMCNGFVLNEIIFDQDGTPSDCCVLEINPAFENITGIKADDLMGKTIKEVFPGTESFWVNKCGEIAISGKPVHFKESSKLFGRFFEVVALTCPQF